MSNQFEIFKDNDTRKVKAWTRLTQKEYDTIKTLLEADLPIAKVASIQDRAYSTVKAISVSNSMEDYLHGVNERAKRNKIRAAERKARRQAALETPVADEPEEIDLPPHLRPVEAEAEQERVKTHFSQDSVSLDRIATALERLADAWERQPEKKSLFGK